MIALLQRVSSARVMVAGDSIAAIGTGLLVLAAAERGDTISEAKRLALRLRNYRVFADTAGRMNRSVHEVGGELLLVPQFTLAADTRSGNRPGFSRAADPADARTLFAALLTALREADLKVQTGQFGADMQVELCNEGPVTLWLQVSPGERKS